MVDVKADLEDLQMEIIKQLPDLIENSKKKALEFMNNGKVDFDREIILKGNIKGLNKLYTSDNIYAMKDLLDRGYKGKIDLIYIDPPFFTMANYWHRISLGEKNIRYLAYNDIWKDGLLEYLEMLTVRLYLMKELLSSRGTIYVHLDYRTVHYVKIIMDCIFGRERFLNEIIWAYRSGGASRRHFARKHDTILAYTKTEEYIFNPQKEKSYNRGLKPYRFKGVKEYQDEIGWYTLVNLRDVWQVDMVGRTSKERIGYGTQKPEALLKLIILSSSNEDSIVADFFAGSGTTAAVAEKHKRNWVISDLEDIAVATIRKRLSQVGKSSYQVLSKSQAKSKINFEIEREAKNQKEYLKFIFKEYKMDWEGVELKEEDREIIEEILKKDSLSLIDYIGIGYKNIKGQNIIKKEIIRRRDDISSHYHVKYLLDEEFKGQVYIKFIDIFGRNFYEIRKINK